MDVNADVNSVLKGNSRPNPFKNFQNGTESEVSWKDILCWFTTSDNFVDNLFGMDVYKSGRISLRNNWVIFKTPKDFITGIKLCLKIYWHLKESRCLRNCKSN